MDTTRLIIKLEDADWAGQRDLAQWPFVREILAAGGWVRIALTPVPGHKLWQEPVVGMFESPLTMQLLDYMAAAHCAVPTPGPWIYACRITMKKRGVEVNYGNCTASDYNFGRAHRKGMKLIGLVRSELAPSLRDEYRGVCASKDIRFILLPAAGAIDRMTVCRARLHLAGFFERNGILLPKFLAPLDATDPTLREFRLHFLVRSESTVGCCFGCEASSIITTVRLYSLRHRCRVLAPVAGSNNL